MCASQGRIARHGLEGFMPPSQQKYSPLLANEMKPISPFGLGLMFFARFVSKKLFKLYYI